MKPRILIVDDEKNIRRTLTMILSREGYELAEAPSGEEALDLFSETPPHAVLLDVGLPGIDGIEVLRRIKQLRRDRAVIMISGQATIATAVEATRLGAFDFLEKPLSKERVLITVRNAVKAANLGEQVDRYRRSEARRQAMVGHSAALEDLHKQIAKVGPTGATILLTGESGVGKELVARALHDASPRVEKVFVKVNCAAIPEELIETELFGCVRGAYTGADRSRDGKFLQADGGTILLDEIGDMSLKVQAKVLRALQEGEIQRVGDSQTRHVDVRVIAATNKDLPAEVRGGGFREDLYYRLNVVPIGVPPLRERRDDIPELADHFLRLYAAENDLPGKSLAPEAIALLRERDWPGNIRELRNVIERLAILSEGDRITREEVESLAMPGHSLTQTETREKGISSGSDPAGWSIPGPDAIRSAGGLTEARRIFEMRSIEKTLDATGGNVSQAARWLGIERSNLHKKMQAYGLAARPSRPGSAQIPEEEP